MKIYIQSDSHYDFHVPEMPPEKYFEEYFLPADVLVCAGDIANTFDVYAQFIEHISQRYNDVVLCLGNHDIVITWDKGRFKTSEEKIVAIKELCSEKKNVHLLDGDCVEIGGLKFGGAMGIWDYSFIESSETNLLEEKVSADWHWRNSWFDGQNWNYFGNDIEAIRRAEMKKLRGVLAQKPGVVLTHFCPRVSRIPSRYKNDFFSTYFYFDRMLADCYTASGAVWCAGHTHTACREENLFVNPLGYPSELPLRFNSLKRECFLLER